MNRRLPKGERVKLIHVISESVSMYGYAGGGTYDSGSLVGNIYGYVVVEFN